MEIIFNHVTKNIGKKCVINDVSFCVNDATIIGLMGINGAGKTMLMRLIAGFIKPSSGSIKIDGKMLGRDMDFPSEIGVLLENPSFINRYNGYDNLRILADINKRIDESRVLEVMDIVGLRDDGLKKYRKFSLGMRQRLGIAAAILEKPNILLLDEPTNSLDESGIEIIKTIVKNEKDRGAIVFLSCHDKELLYSLSDRIFHLNNGCLDSISEKGNKYV